MNSERLQVGGQIEFINYKPQDLKIFKLQKVAINFKKAMYKRYLSKIGGVLRIGWDGVAVLRDQKEDEGVELKIDLLRNGNILKVDDNVRGSIALLIQEDGGRCLVTVLQLLPN